MALTVTLTQSGSTRAGTLLTVKVVTGQAASPVGTAGGSASAANVSITPSGNGSLIYEALYGFESGGFSPESGTSLSEDFQASSFNYLGSGRTTGTTTSGTPVTMGASGSVTNPAVTAVEILAGSALAEDASSPAIVAVNATSATTAAFSPPGGSLIVVMGVAEYDSGAVSLGISNTGMLTFQLAGANGGGGPPGYTAIWTAQVPVTATTVPAQRAAPGRAWLRQFRRPAVTQPGLGTPVGQSQQWAPRAVPGPAWRRQFGAPRHLTLPSGGQQVPPPGPGSAPVGFQLPANPGPAWRRRFGKPGHVPQPGFQVPVGQQAAYPQQAVPGRTWARRFRARSQQAGLPPGPDIALVAVTVPKPSQAAAVRAFTPVMAWKAPDKLSRTGGVMQ